MEAPISVRATESSGVRRNQKRTAYAIVAVNARLALSACGGSSGVTVVGGETTMVEGQDAFAPNVVTDSGVPPTFLISPGPPPSGGQPTEDGVTDESLVRNQPGGQIVSGFDGSSPATNGGWLATPSNPRSANSPEVCAALKSALNFSESLGSADPNDAEAVRGVMDEVIRGAAVLVQELSGTPQSDALDLQNAFVGIRVEMQAAGFDLVALRESPKIQRVEEALEQAEVSAGKLDALAAENCPEYAATGL